MDVTGKLTYTFDVPFTDYCYSLVSLYILMFYIFFERLSLVTSV